MSTTIEPSTSAAESVVAPTWGLLSLKGPDSVDFAQSQLTSDVAQLNTAHEHVSKNPGQLTAYCEPKGRVIANGYLFYPEADHLVLAVHESLRKAMAKRLRMYVLRSKVEIGDSELSLDVRKADSPTAVSETGELKSGSFIAQNKHGFVVDLTDSDASASLWPEEAITAGLPLIQVETTELFTPQMLNLDQLGAVSFSKGCYPGQEIVARTHYLGKVKRRLCRVDIRAVEEPTPGVALVTDEGKVAGTLVNVTKLGAGTMLGLAVVHDSAGDETRLHLESDKGLVAITQRLRD